MPNSAMHEGLMIGKCKIPIRAVPERRARSRQKYGVVLIVNHEHRDYVLAVKAGMEAA